MRAGSAETAANRLPGHGGLLGIARADSLKLSTLNATAAITVRILDATGVYQGELLNVGVPLFLAPTLAVMALAFARRDLRRGWESGVIGAVVLTLLALATSWWPLLGAD